MSINHSCIYISRPDETSFTKVEKLSSLFNCLSTKVNATITSPFGANIKITQVFQLNPKPDDDFFERLLESKFRKHKLRTITCIPDIEDNYEGHLQFTYHFPIPPSGSITSFKASIGNNRKIMGKFTNATQAKQEFQEIVEKHKETVVALATTYSDDIFEVDFGNIPWDSTVEVELVSF